MAEIEVEAEATSTTIKLQITYPPIANLPFKFSLEINIYKQTLPSRTLVKVHHSAYTIVKKQITITDLEPSTMYKVEVSNQYSDKIKKVKNIFVNTQHEELNIEQFENSQPDDNVRPLNARPKSQQKEKKKESGRKNMCNSQIMLKMIGRSSNLQNKHKIEEYIVQGRNCRTVEEFLNEKNDRKNRRDIVMDKKKMLVNGMLFFRELYQHREGHRFFKNDWFMGPFYSYDNNQQTIKRQ